MVSAPILGLPLELVFEIADNLPPDGILALKLTHRTFDNALPLAARLKNKTLSRCERLTMMNYISRPNVEPGRIRCILCKNMYPASLFKSSTSPACLPVSFSGDTQHSEVVQLPQRLCAWHVGRLARIVRTNPGGRNEWTSRMDRMCMHCGAVTGWTMCDCNCDTCTFRPVRAYTRYLNNDTECRDFVFWKDDQTLDINGTHGRLMVRETCKEGPNEIGSVSKG